MKAAAVLALGAVASSGGALVAASPALELVTDVVHAVRRSLPNAPNGYVPTTVDCPSDRPEVRSAASLSTNESSWLEVRRNNTVSAMQTLLERLNITDFDASSYISDNSNNASALPNIAIAVSGGGYRALMNGAGALKAFDNRTENATASGHLGGLLQSATYLAGLSGGGWLVGSLFMNNFTTVTAMQEDPSDTVWQFENSIFVGPDESGLSIVNTAEYYDDIYDQVQTKNDAGYNTTITDYWGRALSYQLINGTNGGLDYTWSSIALTENFVSGDTPLPILVADGRAPGELLISGNTTVYEFNPWEFGSFDPTLYGFVPIEYVGSNFSAGSIPDADKCVRGFDAASYIMGTSSSLFNSFLLNINSTSLPSFLTKAFSAVLADVGEDNDDIAEWYPNPFYHFRNETNPSANVTSLTLVDGGEDLQNIPLQPLIQPVRGVDVIFAVDSSADTDYYWPNGTSLVATYERSLNSSGIANGTVFPSIPDVNTFVNLGLNNRPTFFGCNSSNMTGTSPLVVYLPNAPYVFHSNVSTFDPDYSISQRDSMIENGYDVATMGNGTVDSNWPMCVGCAIISRSLERTGTTVPDVCSTCFTDYCWDGSLNSTVPSNYSPAYKLQELNATSAALSSRHVSTGSVAVVASITSWLLW